MPRTQMANVFRRKTCLQMIGFANIGPVTFRGHETHEKRDLLAADLSSTGYLGSEWRVRPDGYVAYGFIKSVATK